MSIILPLILLAAALFGWLFQRRLRYLAAVREALCALDLSSPRLSISVVVGGLLSVERVAALLKSEYATYQLVVVADYSSNPALLRDLIHYFGLFRAAPTSDEVAIRALYRSHRRLFAHVVVVDASASSGYTPFEVGAWVSHSRYNLQLLATRPTLRPRAVASLLYELASRPEGSVERITSTIAERYIVQCREAALPSSLRKIRVDAARELKISYRILK